MKKRRYVARQFTEYNEDRTIKRTVLLDNNGNHIKITYYDPEGRPLSGICGDFMTWQMKDPHTIVIRGSGDMDNFSWYAPPPWQLHEITTVILEEGVQSIGTNAFISFYTNMHVNNVVFPKSLQWIAMGAFDGCDLPEEVFAPYKLVDVHLF